MRDLSEMYDAAANKRTLRRFYVLVPAPMSSNMEHRIWNADFQNSFSSCQFDPAH